MLLVVTLPVCLRGQTNMVAYDSKRSKQTTIDQKKQDQPFMRVLNYPSLKDTAAFIKELKEKYHLSPDDGNGSRDHISYFKKFRIYGSDKYFYLVEFDWRGGCMATYPWKYQLIFDSSGRLVKVLNEMRFEFLKVFPDSPPFLLSVYSTSRGNGKHELYKIENDTLVNVFNYSFDFCVRTYDSHEDISVDVPNELKLSIKDVNHDGYNDLVFSGYIALIEAVTKDNVWYDIETSKGQNITYSADNPFRKIPIKVVFIYSPKTGMFTPAGDYSKYCLDKIYKLVYNIK